MQLRLRIKYNSKNVQWVVIQATFHTNRNADGDLYVRYLYWNGDTWNWNYNWLDNDWNEHNPALLRATLFISNGRHLRDGR